MGRSSADGQRLARVVSAREQAQETAMTQIVGTASCRTSLSSADRPSSAFPQRGNQSNENLVDGTCTSVLFLCRQDVFAAFVRIP